jgi:hypothetical protein
MYCPKCGTASPDDRKFCKSCGTNLTVISDLLTRGASPGGLQQNMPRSLIEAIFGREEEPPPEQKRLNDIRGGVIASMVGIGVSIFLFFLMNAVAEQVRGNEAMIIRSIWLAGLIPFLIGIGLIINGIFFWKPFGKQRGRPTLESGEQVPLLNDVRAAMLTRPPSVTEQTTTKLEDHLYQHREREAEPTK